MFVVGSLQTSTSPPQPFEVSTDICSQHAGYLLSKPGQPRKGSSPHFAHMTRLDTAHRDFRITGTASIGTHWPLRPAKGTFKVRATTALPPAAKRRRRIVSASYFANFPLQRHGKETDKWFHAPETAPDTKKRHSGVPWRDYAPANIQLAVAFGMETPCGTYMCGCCQQWGRRIVFEPELPPPGREQDRWLAVAYVIGNDRRWVEDVDVRDIINFESSHW